MDEVSAAPDGSGRSDRRSAVPRVAEVLLFAVLGVALGSLVLLVPPAGRSLPGLAVVFGATMASTAVVAVDQRRLRLQVEAREHGSPAPGAPLQQRPLPRRLLVLLYGVYVAQVGWVMSSTVGVVALVAGWPIAYGLALVLVRRSRRRELAAARAAHPGAAVVLVAPTGLALMRLAQWAKATRTTMPASLGARGVLVADADGVRLLGVARTRPLPRWGWDEVELSRGPHPALEGAVAIVLTLLGPVPAERHRAVPVARRRLDVPLSVRGEAWTASPAAVHAALAHLLSRRPVPAGTGASPASGAP